MWYGDGEGLTTIKLTSSATAGAVVWPACNQCQIENMTLDASQSATPSNCQSWTSTGKMVMYDRGMHDQTFTNVNFFGGLNMGVDTHLSRGIASMIAASRRIKASWAMPARSSSTVATSTPPSTPRCSSIPGAARTSPITNCTGQDYDDSISTNGKGWGTGRFYHGNGVWGGVNQGVYLGNITTTGLADRIENDNQGEQFMWECPVNNSDAPFTSPVASATATTATFADLTGGWVAAQAVIVAGDGLGQVRIITNFNASTNTIAVDQPWNVIPDATSVINIVAEPENIAVYHNSLNGKSNYQTMNTSSTGVQFAEGGFNLVVDDNTFSDLNTVFCDSPVVGSGNTITQPMYWVLYQNNTATNCLDAVASILGFLSGTMLDNAVQVLGDEYRNNSFTNITSTSVDWSVNDTYSTGTQPEFIDYYVLDHNTVSGGQVGVGLTAQPSAGSACPMVLYKNNFSLGGGTYSGSEGLYQAHAGADLALDQNTWTGYQTTYAGVMPGAVIDLPDRVLYASAASGNTAQATLPIRDAGTAP